MEREKQTTDSSRDYATLLRMGWSPDSLSEAVDIAGDLLTSGDADVALAAVESARALVPVAGADEEVTALEVLAFRVAVMRGDSPRAIGAANALRHLPVAVRARELAEMRDELAGCVTFRVELREALDSVLLAGPSNTLPEPDERADAPVAFEGGHDDDIPYLVDDDTAPPQAWEFDPEHPWDLEPRAVDAPDEFVPGTDGDAAADADISGDTSAVPVSWSFGAFRVLDGESLGTIRSRFMAAAGEASPDNAADACDMAWSFFLMEDFHAAAVLFDQSLGDPDVRVAAAEGLVRCRLNLAQPAEAIEFLDRLGALCFTEGLPEPLRYWYGRAAEAAGDVRKARVAYRGVSAGAFPDVPGRLGGLP